MLKPILKNYAGTTALAVALTMSLTMNVYLARKAGPGVWAASSKTITINDRLPSPLAVVDADGKATTLTFDDSRPTVVYVLSPLCTWCKKNEANIKAVAASSASRFRFVGLSLVSTNLKEYVADRHAPFPVYAVKSQEQAAKLGLGGTPTTLIVGSGARVQKIWTGAYMGDNVKPVEQFFGVTLPGLQEVQAAAD